MTQTLTDVTIQAFLMNLLVPLATILGGALTSLLIILVIRVFKWMKSKMNADMLKQVDFVVKLFVQAAEQSGLKDEALATGKAKKQWVVSKVQEWLNARGLKGIDAGLLSSLIESAVLEQINRYKPPVIAYEAIEGATTTLIEPKARK